MSCSGVHTVSKLATQGRIPPGTGATVVNTASRRLTGDGFSIRLIAGQLITARGSAQRSTQGPVSARGEDKPNHILSRGIPP
jgi:hypothetical protein